jgi:hypothetical protein
MQAFNQAVHGWNKLVDHVASGKSQPFVVPSRSELPTADPYSAPLPSHPLPFRVTEDNLLPWYPNPPLGDEPVSISTRRIVNVHIHDVRQARAHQRQVDILSAATSPATRSRSNLSTSSSSVAHNLFGAGSSSISNTRASSRLAGPSNAPVASTSTAISQAQGRKYYAVLKGIFPKVYDNEYLARHAIGQCTRSVVREFDDANEAWSWFYMLKEAGMDEVLMDCTCEL